MRLKEIILEVASMHETNVLSMEVMPDHVHLFIEFDPRRMLHKIIKDMKGISSRKLREEFPHLKKRLPTLWTKTYFPCTVGHISEATIKRYISEQKTRSETRREWKARRDNSILHP